MRLGDGVQSNVWMCLLRSFYCLFCVIYSLCFGTTASKDIKLLYGMLCCCCCHRRFSIPFNQTKETKWIALFRDVYKSVCNSSPMHYKMMIMVVCARECVCVCVCMFCSYIANAILHIRYIASKRMHIQRVCTFSLSWRLFLSLYNTSISWLLLLAIPPAIHPHQHHTIKSLF